jgi:hypothetical protein
MARDILNEYGPDYHGSKVPEGHSGISTDGGKPYCKQETYSPPVGPHNIMREGPGLRGGINAGNVNQPTAHDDLGAHHTGVMNHGNCGSQGRH